MSSNTTCFTCPLRLVCKEMHCCDNNDTSTSTEKVEKVVNLRPYYGTIYRQPAYQCSITDELIDKQWLYGFGDCAFDHKVYLSHNRHNQFTLFHGWDVPVALLNMDKDNALQSVEIQTGGNPIQRDGINLLKQYIGYRFIIPE